MGKGKCGNLRSCGFLLDTMQRLFYTANVCVILAL